MEGMAGITPDVPTGFEELEARALEALDEDTYDYVAGATGADAVLVGRPYAYGLALKGADGVAAVCKNLLADLDLTLGLCGLDDVSDVDRELLRERRD